MKSAIHEFPEIRKEIYGKLIKELRASAYELKEDAETWKARTQGPKLRSVYDAEEQYLRSIFAAMVYGDLAQQLQEINDA